MKTNYQFLFSYIFILSLLITITVSCNTADDTGSVGYDKIESGKAATIVIERRKQKFLGIVANVNIYINEKPCGTIKNGERRDIYFIPLKSGKNVIRLEASGAELMDALEEVDPKIREKTRQEIEFFAQAKDKVSFICNYDTILTLKKVDNEYFE